MNEWTFISGVDCPLKIVIQCCCLGYKLQNTNINTVKPGFHYPSWRPELTGDRFPLPVNTGRVDGPSTWLVETRARQHGPCWQVMETGHPSTRAVNSGSGNRALGTPQFFMATYFPQSNGQHLSCNDCLEDKREDCQNCSVLYCVPHFYSVICQGWKNQWVFKINLFLVLWFCGFLGFNVES